ncbi:prepilin-type N-terminal cleavage/methylation domain-containing protein [Sedimentibacter acidaminivorans]|uniref:Prepilin-type N-terminal cleavage/methylation domain-containing protein n=1 Tax=Sedimentibacter acidaminivorans TaxID=913099 RepID=A0ABS4GHZ9_9FIRM|nr:prepilin-type N-terminal cleavage/methylation domain-containing protein [Sedimentibacter acidaminivorans]MBP1927325.1 prepilin-type N-terminal cleavage/methylation domain-containing protein [Sedimentibacter acidaminivorans]
MKEKNGFTLLELLVSIVLFSIIFTLIMSVFLVTFKNYKTIKNDMELQFQAQYILTFMSNKIMVCKYIELARLNTSSYLKKSNEKKISKISFRYGSEAAECYIFENKNNKISYGNGLASSSAHVELGNYVSEMYACPIPEGEIFENTKSVRIRLVLLKDSNRYQAEQIIFMRNN